MTAETTRLYHWTAPTTTHLGSILAEGEIRTTESNLSRPPAPPHAGPPVVWLTTSDDLEGATWTGPGISTGRRWPA